VDGKQGMSNVDFGGITNLQYRGSLGILKFDILF